MDNDITKIKKQILKLYVDHIAISVSKAEVYYHDLDESVVESIFELLQYIASAELTENEVDKRKCYDGALAYTYFVKYKVQIQLTKLLLKRIKYYKNNLRNFKRKGYHINGELFDDVVRRKEKEVRKLYKQHRCMYRFCWEDKQTINMQNVLKVTQNAQLDFDGLVKKCEDIVKIYETNYPNIVNIGYKMPRIYRFFTNAIAVISFLGFIIGLLERFSESFSICYLLERWLG